MIIDIHAQGFAITQALTDHVWRRLGFVLGPYSDRLLRITVGVGEKNGPTGRVDNFCRIQVHLIGAPIAVIQHVGPDLYALMDRAADRVGRVVVRNLDRTQPVRGAPRQRPEALQSAHSHGAIE